jgi:hypothetical protein
MVLELDLEFVGAALTNLLSLVGPVRNTPTETLQSVDGLSFSRALQTHNPTRASA